MVEATCPSCNQGVATLDEVSFETERAGEVLMLCCPRCHVVLGTVKARPVERAVENAGRQLASALGQLADKIQTK